MQRCSATVRLGGDLSNTTVKTGVSPAEVLVLRHIHGDDAVVDIRITGNDRGNAERHHGELGKLRSKYRERVVAAVFPGSRPQLPETFAEVGIEVGGEDDFEAEPDRNPKPARGGRRKKAPAGPDQVTADDLVDGSDGEADGTGEQE